MSSGSPTVMVPGPLDQPPTADLDFPIVSDDFVQGKACLQMLNVTATQTTTFNSFSTSPHLHLRLLRLLYSSLPVINCSFTNSFAIYNDVNENKYFGLFLWLTGYGMI